MNLRSACLVVALCVPAAALATPPHTASISNVVLDPAVDPFMRPPSNLADLRPGALIRERGVTTYLASSRMVAAAPAGLNTVAGGVVAAVPGASAVGIPIRARATEILVRSEDAHDQPVAVTATVFAPLTGARHELISYQPAIDGLGAKCQPSYVFREGSALTQNPAEPQAEFVQLMVAQGYTVVVPDHEGPRNAFAAGLMAGHATLDAIRATLRLRQAEVAGPATKVGMLGYSGGAIATAWAAQLLQSYAPELNVVGAASGGTPADLSAAGTSMDGTLYGGLFVGAALGMAREYPELLGLLNAKGRAFNEQIKDECLAQLFQHVNASIKQYSDYPDPLATALAQRVLATNRLGGTAPVMPYLLWHARLDQLIPYSSAVTLDREWCQRGAQVQFTTNDTSDHVTGTDLMVTTALAWLGDRFAGQTFSDNCPAATAQPVVGQLP